MTNDTDTASQPASMTPNAYTAFSAGNPQAHKRDATQHRPRPAKRGRRINPDGSATIIIPISGFYTREEAGIIATALTPPIDAYGRTVKEARAALHDAIIDTCRRHNETASQARRLIVCNDQTALLIECADVDNWTYKETTPEANKPTTATGYRNKAEATAAALRHATANHSGIMFDATL